MLTAQKVKEMLTPEQVTDILVNECGAPEPRPDNQGHLLFSTSVCHGGDSLEKLFYYIDTHSFYCWTHCHAIDLFEIVRRNKHFDTFKQAFDFVVSYFGLRDDGEKIEKDPEHSEDWDIFQRFQDITPAEEKSYKETIYPERLLDIFSPACAPTEWAKENISPAVMKYYGIRVDAANQRIIIPHRNTDGKLIGIRCRNFNPVALQFAKYEPISVAGKVLKFPTSHYLFGLYQNKETIRRLKKVLIVEGEKSVLQASTYYGLDNCFAVATCGSNISDEQIQLLLNLGVVEIILGYDHDVKGHRNDPDVIAYEQKLYRIIKPLLPYFTCSIIFDYDGLTGYKDSPTDDGKEILEKLMKKKTRLTMADSYKIEKQEGSL